MKSYSITALFCQCFSLMLAFSSVVLNLWNVFGDTGGIVFSIIILLVMFVLLLATQALHRAYKRERVVEEVMFAPSEEKLRQIVQRTKMDNLLRRIVLHRLYCIEDEMAAANPDRRPVCRWPYIVIGVALPSDWIEG
ncbi:MAG: hypothetical protein WCV84_05610 [Patescibacteria group bacterium]